MICTDCNSTIQPDYRGACVACLRREAKRLRADLERANRPWSVRISVPDPVDSYVHHDCKLIDTGYSDRVLIVESDELNAALTQLRADLAAATRERDEARRDRDTLRAACEYIRFGKRHEDNTHPLGEYASQAIRYYNAAKEAINRAGGGA